MTGELFRIYFAGRTGKFLALAMAAICFVDLFAPARFFNGANSAIRNRRLTISP
jgi:hypothetical protein